MQTYRYASIKCIYTNIQNCSIHHHTLPKIIAYVQSSLVHFHRQLLIRGKSAVDQKFTYNNKLIGTKLVLMGLVFKPRLSQNVLVSQAKEFILYGLHLRKDTHNKNDVCFCNKLSITTSMNVNLRKQAEFKAHSSQKIE